MTLTEPKLLVVTDTTSFSTDTPDLDNNLAIGAGFQVRASFFCLRRIGFSHVPPLPFAERKPFNFGERSRILKYNITEQAHSPSDPNVLLMIKFKDLATMEANSDKMEHDLQQIWRYRKS